jgi:arylsulfatase A-like enzyme
MTNAPNLVIVYPDQMRGQALGFLGEEPVRTLHLDRFASQSLVLPQAAASYPVCSPSRAMWFTGAYPWTEANCVTTNCQSRSAPYGVELPETARCWSDVLHDRGYCLGYVGKWHLDAPYAPYVDCANNRGQIKWNEWCPPRRRHGFDHWYAYNTYDYHNRPLYWDTHAMRNGFHYVDQWGPEHEADRAIAYLRNEGGGLRDPDRPFALVVAMNPPHTPYHLVPDEYVNLYRSLDVEELCQQPNIPPAGSEWGDHYRRHVRNYYAMISGVDAQFGRILDALEKEGLAEKTIVLFTSDHGNCLGIHGEGTKNNPYEESVRVPFLVR